jgi:hypothetical protein
MDGSEIAREIMQEIRRERVFKRMLEQRKKREYRLKEKGIINGKIENRVCRY